MEPRAFIDEFCVRQMVSDVGEPAWDVGNIDGAALGVVTVLCAANGIVQCLAAETAVYPDGFAEVLTQRFKDLLAELLEVVLVA